MSRSIGLVLAMLSQLALAACFVSKEPLILESQSVTPMAAGTYQVIDPDDPEPSEHIVVEIDGAKTIMIEEKPDAQRVTLLMREVRAPYYAAAQIESGSEEQDGYLYWLVRVDDAALTAFDSSSNCKALETFAASKGIDISTFGVVSVEEGTKKMEDEFGLDSCQFERFEDLKRAFGVLLDTHDFRSASTLRRVN